MKKPRDPALLRNVIKPTSRLSGWLIPVGAWLVAVTCLGGLSLLLPFVLLVGGLLLPGAALVADALRGSDLSDESRVCAGGFGALLLAIPMYFLRRALPIPPAVFDGLLSLAIFGGTARTGVLGRYLRAAGSPVFRAARWLLAGVVPAVLCLVWLGFEVARAGSIRYYGLFNVDFANLAGVAAMIKTSPHAPEWVTAGGGPLHYHWWFFTIPAWLSEIGGAHGRLTSALALSNLISAVLLTATIVAVVADHRGRAPSETAAPHIRDGNGRLAALTAAVVVLAPFSLYAYQFLVAHAHLSWLTIGDRNSLLLSVVNSMSTFGNNTLALVAVLLFCSALAAYRRRQSWSAAALAAVGGISILGLSVTLAMPVALAAAVLAPKTRQIGRLIVLAAIVGSVGLWLLRATNVLGGDSQHLVLSFDRGHFIQNVALGMAPVWILAGAGLVARRELSWWWAPVTAGVLVPTWIDLAGHTAMSSTMSMKIASMLPVVAAPLVADGLRALWPSLADGSGAARAAGAATSIPRRSAWRVIAMLALAAGLINSLAYSLQFGFYRLSGHDTGRFNELPADYVQALTYVREHSPRGAVVADPNGDLLRDTICTLLISERQVWLPTRYSAELVHTDIDNAEIMARLEIWRSWERGHFADGPTAETIADRADFLVAPPGIESAAWERQVTVGAFAVYRSRRRQPR